MVGGMMESVERYVVVLVWLGKQKRQYLVFVCYSSGKEVVAVEEEATTRVEKVRRIEAFRPVTVGLRSGRSGGSSLAYGDLQEDETASWCEGRFLPPSFDTPTFGDHVEADFLLS